LQSGGTKVWFTAVLAKPPSGDSLVPERLAPMYVLDVTAK
jgi:hypothetical protein